MTSGYLDCIPLPRRQEQGNGLAKSDSSQEPPLESAQSNKGDTNDIESGLRLKIIHAICYKLGVGCNIKQIEAIENLIAQGANKARIHELKSFNPFFKGDHTKCLNYPEGCIGYQNAESDFENEREIRIAQLTADKEQA